MTVPAYDPSRSDQSLSTGRAPQGLSERIDAALHAKISDQAFRTYAAALYTMQRGLPYVTEDGLGSALGEPPARVRHALGELARAGYLVRRQRVIGGTVRSAYEVGA